MNFERITYPALLLTALGLPSIGEAASISSTFFRQLNDNSSDEPWFTPSGGSNYQGNIASRGGSVSTVTATGLTINGSASQTSGFTDGNGIPQGVSLAFDVSFDITANGGGLLVDGGNNGLGIDTSDDMSDDALDTGDQLLFSAIAFSNVMVTSDSNGYLADNSVLLDAAGWNILRSNDFDELANGATTSSDAAATANITGFGTSGAGAINNNFSDGSFGPLGQVYITTDAGSWKLKGIGYQFNATVNVVPEPTGITLAFAGLVLGALAVRTRV